MRQLTTRTGAPHGARAGGPRPGRRGLRPEKLRQELPEVERMPPRFLLWEGSLPGMMPGRSPAATRPIQGLEQVGNAPKKTEARRGRNTAPAAGTGVPENGPRAAGDWKRGTEAFAQARRPVTEGTGGDRGLPVAAGIVQAARGRTRLGKKRAIAATPLGSGRQRRRKALARAAGKLLGADKK